MGTVLQMSFCISFFSCFLTLFLSLFLSYTVAYSQNFDSVLDSISSFIIYGILFTTHSCYTYNKGLYLLHVIHNVITVRDNIHITAFLFY